MICQCYCRPEQRPRLFAAPPYQPFDLSACDAKLVEFGAMLHLWRNPPGIDWIGFTSWRQLDKSLMVFQGGEVEALLAKADVVTWLQIRAGETVAEQSERHHPGIMAFLWEMFGVLCLGSAAIYHETNVGIFGSYWAMRWADFDAFMAWFSPALDYCLSSGHPYLASSPKAAGYALERLFMAWVWQTGRRVVDRTEMRQ